MVDNGILFQSSPRAPRRTSHLTGHGVEALIPNPTLVSQPPFVCCEYPYPVIDTVHEATPRFHFPAVSVSWCMTSPVLSYRSSMTLYMSNHGEPVLCFLICFMEQWRRLGPLPCADYRRSQSSIS